jgi:copper resistance protein C
MTKPFVPAAALALVIVASATPAFAHAHLKHSDPAAGATGAAPTSITLDFSEGVVPGLSRVTLADTAGHAVKLGPAVNGAAATSLVAPIPDKLAPGTYVVTWRAVSTDTHRTQGTFKFTVAP